MIDVKWLAIPVLMGAMADMPEPTFEAPSVAPQEEVQPARNILERSDVWWTVPSPDGRQARLLKK